MRAGNNAGLPAEPSNVLLGWFHPFCDGFPLSRGFSPFPPPSHGCAADPAEASLAVRPWVLLLLLQPWLGSSCPAASPAVPAGAQGVICVCVCAPNGFLSQRAVLGTGMQRPWHLQGTLHKKETLQILCT